MHGCDQTVPHCGTGQSIFRTKRRAAAWRSSARWCVILNFDIEIVGCPIIREEDGLAKSSRNTYLSQEERKSKALCLSKAVKLGQETIHTGIAAEELLGKMRAVIEAEPLAKIDYVSMVDALTMQPVEKSRPGCSRSNGCLHRKNKTDR